MNKSALGIVAAVVVLVGGGGGCLIKQHLETPPATSEKQAPAPGTPVEPAPAPPTPDPSARESSTPSMSEIVVTKQTDNADLVTPPAPAPAPAAGSTGAAQEKTEASANVSPGAGKVFASAEASNGITFRWTALVPKPQQPVTYRIKVWQLMEGQNGTTAMRTNKPIVTKDVDSKTEATVSGIYTGPCKPPYLCDFVWGVTATSGGTDMGMSAITSFSVAAETTSSKSDADGTAGTP